MSSRLTKSKKRVKEQGEVYTPPQLVDLLLDLVPERVLDCGSRILDPACGTGNFLVAIVARRLAAGHAPLVALESVYGIDIAPDNVEECRARLQSLGVQNGGDEVALQALLERRIKCANTLEVNIEELFGD